MNVFQEPYEKNKGNVIRIDLYLRNIQIKYLKAPLFWSVKLP